MDNSTGRNLTSAVRRNALIAPQSIAIVLGTRSVTYEELDASISRAAHWLHNAGLRPRAIVGVVFTNPLSCLVTLLGLIRLGATAFPLSPGASPYQIQDALQAAGSDVLVTDAPTSPAPNARCLSLKDPMSLSSRSEPFPIFDDDFVALLIAGSGSTGRPRQIPITNDLLIVRFQIIQKLWSMSNTDRVMLLSPPHFSAPTHRILAALSVGATAILWDSSPLIPARLMEFAPDILHLSVLHAEQILKNQSLSERADFSKIRIVSIGASTVTDGLRSRLRDILAARLHVHYGSNETHTISYAGPEDLASTAGTVGRPPLGVSVEIVDQSLCAVRVGQVGQLRVKSPAQITNYHLELDPNRFRNGWFYPGDLAKWTQDGQIVHCGRLDQMMITNGVNIYPAEIERVLEEHPSVREVVVFPLSHPVAQDIAVAAIVMNADKETTQAELENYARERLGARAPRIIGILNVIPRSEQGKPQRAELRAMFLSAIKRGRKGSNT